jgi:Asp-tRNA(Asn)/Glu-tRNA(Gln) amidotransferase C subunit
MSISRDDVIKIAELARLEIPEAHVERMARELSAVLDYAARSGSWTRRLRAHRVRACRSAVAERRARRAAHARAGLDAAPEGEPGFSWCRRSWRT